jgi:hypothetical protein
MTTHSEGPVVIDRTGDVFLKLRNGAPLLQYEKEVTTREEVAEWVQRTIMGMQ